MKEITKEQEDRLLLYSIYTILYLNDTACFSVQQLNKDVMERDKESQKIYKALLKRNKFYLNKMSSIVDRSIDYYCDYCTAMDEICDNAYSNFKDSLQKAYKEVGIDDYEYIAKVETMRSMVEISVEAGKKTIDSTCKYIPQTRGLESYLLKDMLRIANNFSNWAYRKVPKDIRLDFNENSDVMQKFRTLSTCLIDYFSFEKAYISAISIEKEQKNQ